MRRDSCHLEWDTPGETAWHLIGWCLLNLQVDAGNDDGRLLKLPPLSFATYLGVSIPTCWGWCFSGDAAEKVYQPGFAKIPSA